MALALYLGWPGGVAYEFRVVIKPEERAKFLESIKSIATEGGMETDEAKAVADTGDTMWVVEGRGHRLKLWVQSTPLSGREDPELCGKYSEPHSDPAQFTVFTEPRFFGSSNAAKELGERIHSQIQKAGFEVLQKPPLCGNAVLRNRESGKPGSPTPASPFLYPSPGENK